MANKRVPVTVLVSPGGLEWIEKMQKVGGLHSKAEVLRVALVLAAKYQAEVESALTTARQM